jgi:hypothetical protein
MQFGMPTLIEIKSSFYEKFGFSSRPRENRGAGMDLWLSK